jgi:hypothetical protein
MESNYSEYNGKNLNVYYEKHCNTFYNDSIFVHFINCLDDSINNRSFWINLNTLERVEELKQVNIIPFYVDFNSELVKDIYYLLLNYYKSIEKVSFNEFEIEVTYNYYNVQDF